MIAHKLRKFATYIVVLSIILLISSGVILFKSRTASVDEYKSRTASVDEYKSRTASVDEYKSRTASVAKYRSTSVRRNDFDTDIIFAECIQKQTTGITRVLNVTFRIIVVTYNRGASLNRLLSSINEAVYDTAEVVLEIWIDRSNSGDVHKDTLETARNFLFKHGEKRICVHRRHVGIMGQWLATWNLPKDNKEIAVILEDDITVSRWFWKYLKSVHEKYGHRPDINGFALQGISIKHAGNVSGNLDVDTKHRVFSYPTLGTSGFSPNRQHWFSFVKWFINKYNELDFLPLVPNHKGTIWYTAFTKTHTEDSIWDIWHTYYTWMNKEYTLYPNFPGHKGLSFNWLENGLHYQGQAVKQANADFENLLQEWKPEYEDLPSDPVKIDNYGNTIPQH